MDVYDRLRDLKLGMFRVIESTASLKTSVPGIWQTAPRLCKRGFVSAPLMGMEPC